MKQARKKYSQEFKQEALQMVTVQGYTFAQTSESLGDSRENDEAVGKEHYPEWVVWHVR